VDIETLSKQFLVDDEVGSDRLGKIIEGLLPYCVVRTNGSVEVAVEKFSGKNQVKLVLASRLVASKLERSTVSGEVSASEISKYTGLPKNQAAARAKDCVDERFADRSTRGTYIARQNMLERFLAELTSSKEHKEAR
jgi:hypothetical protein